MLTDLTRMISRGGATNLDSISLTVNGNGAALLFAASDSTPFTSVDLSNGSFNDFAIAQPRFLSPVSPVPEPDWVFLFGTMLLSSGCLLSKFVKRESWEGRGKRDSTTHEI